MKSASSTAPREVEVKPRRRGFGFGVRLVSRDTSGSGGADPSPQDVAPARLVSTGTSRRGGAEGTLVTGLRPPKYVRKCPNSEWQKAVPYQLLLWPAGDPSKASLVEAKCRSWRCKGECRRHNGKVTWARVVEALERHDEQDVLFAVLTIDRNGYYSGRSWPDSTTAYRELSSMGNKWMKRINRMCERLGVEAIQSRWVGVVEQHRSGWPHINLIIVCPGLAALVRKQQAELDSHSGEYTPLERALVRGEVMRHAEAAGWGRRSTLEVARSRGAVAGYMVKLCGLHDEPGTEATRSAAVTGEVVKLSQIPMAAPKGFRRLRSGVRFLPTRRRSEFTGALLDEGRVLDRTDHFRRIRKLAHRIRELEQLPELGAHERLELFELAGEHDRCRRRLDELVDALAAAGVPSRVLAGVRSRVEALARVDEILRRRAAKPRIPGL